MKSWNGLGVYQWEYTRKWDVAGASSEFVRADGALALPGGFNALSFFFRRQSQTNGPFELAIWTAPIYFRNLDDLIDPNNASQSLLQIALEPATGLQMSGTAAQVFGARSRADNPMGTLLFWQMKNTGTTGSIVGDLYVVPNHIGALSSPSLARFVELGCEQGGIDRALSGNFGGYGRR